MASAMLEAYDAQMLDYPSDIDVPMHPSSTDLWFQNEATMEDDGLFVPQKSLITDQDNSTAVEVDMQPYDNENTEYEMADEVETYELETGESVDVEVFDVSQAHTPSILDIDTPRIVPNVLVEPTPNPPLFTESPAPDHPLQSKDLASPSPLFTGSLETPPVIPLEIHEALPENDVERTEALVADAVPPSEGLVGNHDTVPVEEQPAETSTADKLEVATVDLSQGPESSLPDHVAENVDLVHTEEHHEFPYLASTTDPVETAQHDAPEEFHEDDQEYDTVVAATADPHEISEGVYIDPPPAVLVSLLSSNLPELCLFNQPLPNSGSASPSPQDSGYESSALTLLLHHRPTLYYEPLISVFEALHREEVIASVPEFADGELVLDAFDLQLVISEDSIYSREVTLHDLNVLHDGSDIYGPLRLQLKATVPRFIVRYHMLQEQVNRLNLAAEAREDSGEVPSEEQHIIGEYHEQETGLDFTEEDEEAAVQEHDVDQQPDLQNIHQEVAGDQLHSEADASDELQLHTEQPEKEVQGDSDHAQEHELEYIADPRITDDSADRTEEAEEAEETSDADEVYQIADTNALAPADDEYTEYQDFAELHDEGDDERETFQGDGADSTAGHIKSNVFHDSPVPFHHSLLDPSPGHVTGRQAESEVVVEDDAEKTIGNEHNNGLNHEISKEISTSDEQEGVLDEPGKVSKYTNHESHAGVDQSDSSPVVVLEGEADTAPVPSSSSLERLQEAVSVESGLYAEDEEEWDDNLDGEGEPDTTWEADHDTASNQSSVTLSSKTSKRSFDEVEPDDNYDRSSPINSPGTNSLAIDQSDQPPTHSPASGSKRPRVQ